jgi:EmrB/QacA subfamily drug resistance transporter
MSSEPDLSGADTRRPRNFRIIAIVIASSLFMEQLDATVLTTALPTMAQSFGVSPLHMSVALTAYLLSLAVFIPASGWVADRYGARTVFCSAIGIFTFGSILCGLANGLTFLVAARLIQGLGGALMVPIARLILLRNVAMKDFISAMSWMLVPALIGPILGPPIGGLIVTYLDWRWIFYVNVPIGIIGIALAIALVTDSKEPPAGRFDFIGLILAGIALSCLTFGVELGARGVLTATGTALIFGAAVLGAVLYVLHARRLQQANPPSEPILDMRLMRIPTFSLSVIAGGLTRITGGATPFLLPMMMQLGFGMSAAESGFVTFVNAIGFMLMKAAATPMLRRFGFRQTMVWNALIATGCIALYAAFRPGWPIWSIYLVLLLGGFFQSLQFAAYNTIAYADIPRARMSQATSFYATFQQLMLSLGICFAAGALHLSVAWSGHDKAGLGDFSVAFLLVTTISLLASPVCLLFPRNAGHQMRGLPAPEPASSSLAAAE